MKIVTSGGKEIAQAIGLAADQFFSPFNKNWLKLTTR
jgi:hypothetical protein